MKRHPQLLQLSREHHGALRLALQAQRATASGDPASIAATAALCLAAFEAELDVHFRVEDDTLLPLLRAAGESRLAERLVGDHAALRGLCAQLRDPDAATLGAFAKLLTAHVRFEEREMFVVLQALLAP